jgi:hypothetical protein
LDSKIDQESDRAIEEENKLRVAIEEESDRAQRAENQLREDLDDEINRAISKENELEEKINNEIQRAINKENDLDKRKAEKTDNRFNKIMVVFDGTNFDENGWCSIIKGYGVKGVKRISEGRYRIYFEKEVKDGYIPMVVGNGNNTTLEADAKYNLKINSELYEDGFEVANVAEELAMQDFMKNFISFLNI